MIYRKHVFVLILLFSNVMGIFQLLKHFEHPIALKEFNQYLNFYARLEEANVCVSFNKECIDLNRYTTHYYKSLRRHRIYPDCKTLKIVALNHINTIQNKIPTFEQNIAQRKPAVDDLPEDLKVQFERYVLSVTETRREKKKSRLLKSLDKCITRSNFPTNPERYVHNFSKLNLDVTQLEVLSLGPKFCDSIYPDNHLHSEVQFENLYAETFDLKLVSEIELEKFNSTLVTTCYQYRTNKSCNKGILSQHHRNALKELRKNKDILITKPDKGAGIVLLNVEDYRAKMNFILSDEFEFQKLGEIRDPTERNEKQLCEFLKSLRVKNIISADIFDKLKSTGSHIPRLYGLPKVHKSGDPLRPILDMSGSP